MNARLRRPLLAAGVIGWLAWLATAGHFFAKVIR
jgi:hypothetical protein